MGRVWLAVVCLVCLVCGCGDPRTAEVRSGLTARVSPDVWQALEERPSARVMVAFVDVARRGSLDIEELQRTRSAVLAALEPGDFALARSFETVAAMAGDATRAGVDSLASLPEVAAISLDPGGSAGLAESVPLVGADKLHIAGLSGAGSVVAVLDTGIDADHPDLAAVPLVAEHCVCEGGCCPNGSSEQNGPGSAADDEGHGTAVTSVVASQGVMAARGVAPGVSVVAVKVLGQDGLFANSSQVVAGLDWLIANQPSVDVVNMSLGSFQTFGSACDGAEAWTMAWAQAIDTLTSNGVAVFAISGNDAKPTEIQAPGCIDATLTVGAVFDANVGPMSFDGVCPEPMSAADRVPCFSNASGMVDMLAPGAMITTSQLNGATEIFWGTSFAAPHAAGAAALLRSIDPTLDPAAIESTLESTGVSVLDARNGLTFPRIDVDAAARAVDPPLCGDGANQIGEACDDGNTVSGDGCSGACDEEEGFTCDGEPSNCTSQCGDGVLAFDEACDDGDTRDGDGCSSTCADEAAGTGGTSAPIADTADRCEDDCCCRAVGGPSGSRPVTSLLLVLLAALALQRRRWRKIGSRNYRTELGTRNKAQGTESDAALPFVVGS